MKAGKKVLVIDEARPSTATKIASGIINPVTGRRIVRTWRIEELLPFSLHAYSDFGKELSIDLIRQCNILDFHPSLQMKEAFETRSHEETDFLKLPENANYLQEYFSYHYGVGEINPCLLVDLNAMLEQWRNKLVEENNLHQELFNWKDFKTSEEHITYKNVTAKKIIFCEPA